MSTPLPCAIPLCHHQFTQLLRFPPAAAAAEWGFSTTASPRGDTTVARGRQAHCLFTKQPWEDMLSISQVLLNILRCWSMFCACTCKWAGVFLYMSVNVFASPVFVSHPKQSDMTAHSGAPKAAEPALTHTNTHKCMHLHRQKKKHQTTNTETRSLNKHHSSVQLATFLGKSLQLWERGKLNISSRYL